MRELVFLEKDAAAREGASRPKRHRKGKFAEGIRLGTAKRLAIAADCRAVTAAFPKALVDYAKNVVRQVASTSVHLAGERKTLRLRDFLHAVDHVYSLTRHSLINGGRMK